MAIETVVQAIDSEINRLQQARRFLVNGTGSTGTTQTPKAQPQSTSRFSEATRQKMARAQRARWKSKRQAAQPLTNEGA